jgi:predicted phage terminase large subunit-like protein
MALIEKKRREIEREPWQLAKVLYPKYTFEPFHREWFELDMTDEENLCLAPRNFGKTTVRGVIRSVVKLIRNPNIQLGIVSDTGFQATHFIGEIKAQLEQNMLLRAMYPHLAPGKKWTDAEGATDIRKGCSVMAMSYGGAVTGFEFDDILADDIVDFENSRTKYQRDKLIDWLGITLLPMLKKGGTMGWSGTRYHQDDYYGKLLNKGIKTNTESHRALKEDGTALWPEMYSIEWLLKKKENIGTVNFNAQYQNDTKLMAEGQVILRQWFKYVNMNEVPEKIRIIQICDLAISKSETANYFVESTFGLDMKKGDIYMLDMDRGRYSWHEQKQAIRRNNDKWKARAGQVRIYIEGNQYQTVLAQEMDTAIDLSITSFTTVKDKVTALRGISPKFENGRFFFVNSLPGLDIIEDELCSFPDGDYDDICDTISGIQKVTSDRRPSARSI